MSQSLPAYCVYINEYNMLQINSNETPPNCFQFVILSNDSYSDFESLVAGTELPINYELLEITPENIAISYTWGFGAILTIWAIVYAIAAAQKVINKT